jgi:hypothetical protein
LLPALHRRGRGDQYSGSARPSGLLGSGDRGHQVSGRATGSGRKLSECGALRGSLECETLEASDRHLEAAVLLPALAGVVACDRVLWAMPVEHDPIASDAPPCELGRCSLGSSAGELQVVLLRTFGERRACRSLRSAGTLFWSDPEKVKRHELGAEIYWRIQVTSRREARARSEPLEPSRNPGNELPGLAGLRRSRLPNRRGTRSDPKPRVAVATLHCSAVPGRFGLSGST